MAQRLEVGFRRRFRDLLALVRPRRLEFGVELLLSRARAASEREGKSLPQALLDLYLFTRRRVARRLVVTGTCSVVDAPWDRFKNAPPAFLADGSLGGLVRWLRAAGYEARATSSGKGASLLREARERGRVLVTSVADLLERRLVRSGEVVALYVPTDLSPTDQLTLVLADLGLGLRQPLCMACGGELEATAKETVRGRIPPRTALWKDDYWVCRACARLFWKGTHWERIARALETAAA